MRRPDAQALRKIDLSLVVLCRPFRLLYLFSRLDYWARHCSFELRLHRLSFVCIVMRGGYSLTAIKRICSPPLFGIPQVIASRFWVGGKSWRDLVCFGLPGLRSLHLFQLHFEISSSTKFVLQPCDVKICGMHIYLVSQAGFRWHKCVSFW